MNNHGINEAIIPIGGGWRYDQEYTVGESTIMYRIPEQGSAQSFGDLVDLVTIFRANQGIDIGEPDFDVANFIKSKSRQNDIYRTGPIVKQNREITPLIQSCRVWLDAMQQVRPQLISTEEATERASGCEGCPQNVEWKVKGCGDCNEQVIYKGACLRRMTSFPDGDKLRACRLHRIYLPAAIFIDRESLPDRSAAAPNNCWMTTRSHDTRRSDQPHTEQPKSDQLPGA